MTFVRKLSYEFKITFGATMLLPILILPVFAFLSWMTFNPNNESTMPMVVRIAMIFQYGLPLIAGLAVAHLMGVEGESDFDTLRDTFPEKTWQPFVYRVLIGLGAVTVSALTAGAIFLVAHGEFDFIGQLRMVYPALLVLFGISILSNTATGNFWISMALVVGYWVIDLNTSGKYTQSLYLFQNISPNPTIDTTTNAIALLLVTVACLSLAVVVRYGQRKGWLI